MAHAAEEVEAQFRDNLRLRVLSWSCGKHVPFEGWPQEGESEAFVLLHGLGDTADVWRPLVELWRPQACVVAVDLPGHGRSSWFKEDAYLIDTLANAVAIALDRAGIRRQVLIGHSLGARLCMELATRTTSSVEGIVLIEPSPGTNDLVVPAMLDHLDAISKGCGTIEELIELYRERLPLAACSLTKSIVPRMAAQTERGWTVPFDPKIRQLLFSTKGSSIEPALQKIQIPSSIIRGAYSAILSIESAYRIAANFHVRPMAIHTVPMAGHAIPFEQPGRLAAFLRNFVCRSQLLLGTSPK